MTKVSLDGAYRDGLEVIRKQYRATIRNRSGKVYLTVYWKNGSFEEYDQARSLVEECWPDAYVTSASTMIHATFRLNPTPEPWEIHMGSLVKNINND